MNNKLDRKLFYSMIKPYINKYIPIFIQMPINKDSNIYISLSETRLTTDKIDYDFNLQIFNKTISGAEKYLCKDIEFNLLKENIYSDYQLYKFINKKLINILEVENENKS